MTTKTKDWNEVTTDYVNSWTETSTKIWQNWFDLMTKMPTVKPLEQTFPDWEKFNQMWLDNQELLTRFVKLSVQAWQDVFPEMELDSNWQEILTKYTKQMQTELTSFATSYQESNKNWSELWQFYLKQNEKLVSLWLEPLGLSKTTFNEFMMGKSSGLIELNNLYWNLLYDKGIGSFIKSPLLGPTREINAKILAGFDAWKDLYQASTNYQVLLAEIQVKSFEELIKELAARNEKGEIVKDWKEFQTLWSQTVDKVFEEAFQQEDNLKVRGSFINSLNQYRIKQQEINEFYFELLNIPTRKEVDEMHKTIYELRKEVKALQKQLENNQ
jgi:class III poly(R)-hydroxyalkanoic acid synthase PhaE subunit